MPGRRVPAFSLVEVLVAIGVIAVLLAILLPALRGARDSSWRTLSRSNVRQLHAAITLYADGSDELFPATEPGRLYPTDGDILVGYPYWHIYFTWPGVIHDVLPFRDHADVYLSPGAARAGSDEGRWPSSYVLSTSVAGHPSLWSGDAVADPQLQRAAKVSSVRYPASKALLWDAELPFVRPSPAHIGADLAEVTPMGMIDGSVSDRTPSQASSPVRNPFEFTLDRARLHNTGDGVLGRDY